MTLSLVRLPESPDPNVPQIEAATPDYDVWVAASAGSGKTKVLTDRVLRLLLPDPYGRWDGAQPHTILCITFTKAAAALMALRVQKKLGEWAIMSDIDLTSDLVKLLGVSPSDHVLKSARMLFSKVLDVPDGLSIMTIHAFCQSTLGRFAIEAGITPGFTVIEESAAHILLCNIIDDFITKVVSDRTLDLGPSFSRIATYLDLDTLRDTLLHIMGKSREVTAFLKTCEESNGCYNTLLDHLGFRAGLTLDLPLDELSMIASLLSTEGTSTDKANGHKIASWLALDETGKHQSLSDLAGAFLTQKGEVRAVKKSFANTHPDFFIKRDHILNLISSYQDNIAKARQAEQTSDLMEVVNFCLYQYTSRKRELNSLDFNDLIVKTRLLLESGNMDWVHYKLDEGIDHILVDEAQDTNAHQWEIIRLLAHDFLSGHGNDTRQRSLFVVGDEKQSIFSFHGADPEAFHTMREYFKKRSDEAGRKFKEILLETSFRSVRPILQLVDAVFEPSDLSERIGLSKEHRLTHFAHRDKSAGLIELWEPILKEKVNTRETSYQWNIPVTSLENKEIISTASLLAGQIARTIAGWVDQKEILESTGQKIEPRDILVLVRTRTNFVPDLIRQLKKHGIPVSGVDRMKLTEQISVMDCLSLAKFARYPDDDLSLACLLKSPFIRMDEDGLMNISLDRSNSLWDEVQKHCPSKIVSWLNDIITKARTRKPFDFFDDILNRYCPYQDNCSGWKAFETCLGSDCIDPLDEFLSYCLASEERGVFSLEELVSILEKSEIEIKRDNEDGSKDSANQVRIMTVHASKGLEAPIVFLPDTMSVPSKGKIDPLQWITSLDNQKKIPLWAAISSDGCRMYQNLKSATYDKMISEHLRLLYVALTRPRDRLYIMGETTTLNLNDFSWYSLVHNAFQKLPYQKTGSILRYQTTQEISTTRGNTRNKENAEKLPLPDWALRSIPENGISRIKTLQPSRLSGEENDNLVRSPLESGKDANSSLSYRFLRGNLTHKLFQILPELPLNTRKQAAEKFLSRTGHRLGKDICNDIVRETLDILNDPVFSDVFGQYAMAEVPIAGNMGDGTLINGQIDRLIISPDKILIVDFKTNRPSPQHHSEIPNSYKNQLIAYKTALARIYPDRPIYCALLWTDQPLLMPVDV